jgi:hypothetical protein
MSQFYIGTTAGALPPQVPTSFVTDNGTVVPAGNVVNINGGTSTVNNTNGIQVIANPNGSNNEIVQLTNRAVGSTTTVGAVTAPVITFPLGAVPGTYTFDIQVAGFATAGVGSPLAAGFTVVGAVRTTGAAAILIPTQVVDHFEEGALSACTCLLGVSGNNALVNVTGVAGFTIDWQGTLNYTLAT